MNVMRDDYVAATNTTYMYSPPIHVPMYTCTTHARTYTYTRKKKKKHAYTVAVTLEERDSQPCE